MTDLLTKEEREIVEKIRVEHRTFQQHIMTKMDMITTLLRIIDNLSKRGVKKYSEEELQKKFEEIRKFQLTKFNGRYTSEYTRMQWVGFRECACFLGALEEK